MCCSLRHIIFLYISMFFSIIDTVAIKKRERTHPARLFFLSHTT